MHPTPALGGYPKNEALKFIEENEFGTRAYMVHQLVIST